MGFKLNNPPYKWPVPIYHVDMEDDVMGKANNNLTIIINKDVCPSRTQDVINHEIVEITNFDDHALDEVIELHVYDTIGSYVTSDHVSDHWKHFADEDSFVHMISIKT